MEPAMKKTFALSIIALLLVLLLCSCADVSVSYGLSDDNTVSIGYTLVLKPSGEDAGAYIDAITGYWESMGFSVSSANDNGSYTINGDKTLSGDSRSAAAAKLSSVLTDEDSLFYDAAFKYLPSYFEDNYSFSAKISLENIIRKSEDRPIPAAEVQSLLASAKAGEYRLSISLPGEVVDTNSDERDGQACVWLLKYGETKEISISSKKAFEENAAHYASLNETQSRDDMLFTICGIAAGALVLFIIIAVLVRRAGRSKVGVKRL
jgi:hypothetical protein